MQALADVFVTSEVAVAGSLLVPAQRLASYAPGKVLCGLNQWWPCTGCGGRACCVHAGRQQLQKLLQQCAGGAGENAARQLLLPLYLQQRVQSLFAASSKELQE
jgi:hypothetical protein